MSFPDHVFYENKEQFNIIPAPIVESSRIRRILLFRLLLLFLYLIYSIILIYFMATYFNTFYQFIGTMFIILAGYFCFMILDN